MINLAQKEYNNALIYEKLEYYTAALRYYDSVFEVIMILNMHRWLLYNKI